MATDDVHGVSKLCQYLAQFPHAWAVIRAVQLYNQDRHKHQPSYPPGDRFHYDGFPDITTLHQLSGQFDEALGDHFSEASQNAAIFAARALTAALSKAAKEASANRSSVQVDALSLQLAGLGVS
jgi:hypothetical protein